MRERLDILLDPGSFIEIGVLNRSQTAELHERTPAEHGNWLDLMAEAADLHPITRACMGFHLWNLAGLGQYGDRMEAAVTAARIAASEGPNSNGGAIFAPLAIRGAGGLRASGPPAERFERWLEGMETACMTAMRCVATADTPPQAPAPRPPGTSERHTPPQSHGATTCV